MNKIIILLSIIIAQILCIQYDFNRSQLIFNYSFVTHCNQQPVQKWECQICKNTKPLHQITYIHQVITGVVCYVGIQLQQNIIILGWRGSKNIQNWIEDFSFDFMDYPHCRNCRIHEGFYLDYLSVHNKILKAIQEIIKKHASSKIIVTGSSLGAALATVSALEIQLKFRLETELHTFGSPRVGNEEYSKFLNNNIYRNYRVVHNRDIIPHLPFISLGFHHSAYQVLFDQQMRTYVICDASGQDPNCSNRFDPKYSIQDHVSYWIKSDANIC